MFPRSTFQLFALCLTLFSSSVWFFSSRTAGANGHSASYLHYGRAPPTPPADVRVNVDVTESASDPIWDIQNRTLGFQKIYAISMPHRTDKRDFLALMALVSDLEIEFFDGVNGSEIHPTAYPSFWSGEDGPGTLGCWRAHVDLYQKMVRERIQSALVLEDDADWDVLIKAQMTEVARGTRYLQNATLPLHSPYGDNWDLLTVGHTGANNKPNRDQHYWLSKNDPTVVHPTRRTWGRTPDFSAPSLEGDYNRIIHEASKLTGTAGYAISLRGAARILYDQTMGQNARSIDTAMANICRRDPFGSPFCLSAYPMLFGRYRPAGPQDKDSDRRLSTNEAGGAVPQSKDIRTEAVSEFTVFPVSLNVQRLLMSEHVIPANDPDTDLIKEIDVSTAVLPRGKGVFVRTDEYVEFGKIVAERKKEEEAAQKNLAVKKDEGSQEEVKIDGQEKVQLEHRALRYRRMG